MCTNDTFSSGYPRTLGCINGHRFDPHDSAGFVCATCVDVDGGAGGNMHHRSPQAGLVLNVGSIGVDPLFGLKSGGPRVWCRHCERVRHGCRSPSQWEAGCFYQTGKGLGGRVPANALCRGFRTWRNMFRGESVR